MSPVANRIRRIMAAAFLFLICAVTAQAQGHWVKLAPFPEPAQEIVGAAGSGKVYVLGGLAIGSNTAPKWVVWVYDIATDKWAKEKPMPLPAHHLAVTEYRGKVYVFGGGAQLEPGGPNWIPISNAWEYDPANDTWQALAPMPTA